MIINNDIKIFFDDVDILYCFVVKFLLGPTVFVFSMRKVFSKQIGHNLVPLTVNYS